MQLFDQNILTLNNIRIFLFWKEYYWRFNFWDFRVFNTNLIFEFHRNKMSWCKTLKTRTFNPIFFHFCLFHFLDGKFIFYIYFFWICNVFFAFITPYTWQYLIAYNNILWKVIVILHISLQPDWVNIWYFKLRLLDLTEFMDWNI